MRHNFNGSILYMSQSQASNHIVRELLRGNQIGVITDLEAAVLASGFDEDIYVLVPELQKEIDGLKHNTCADRSVLKEIRERAPKPAWLSLKNPTSLSDMPLQLDVLPTDRIGRYYNSLRPEIAFMIV